MPPHTALLMLRVFVDAQGAPSWMARVSAFGHPTEEAREAGPLTRVEDVLDVVRAFMVDTIGSASGTE